MENGTINIGEHIESAAKSFLKGEGKELINKAVEDYFDGRKYYSRRKAKDLLDISFPTLKKWERMGLINSSIVAGRVCFSADEIERVKSADLRYKRDV